MRSSKNLNPILPLDCDLQSLYALSASFVFICNANYKISPLAAPMLYTPSHHRHPGFDPYRISRMTTRSAQYDADAFTATARERVPAAREASRRLQGILGISPGSKLVGNSVVKLPEMPEPPSVRAARMQYNAAIQEDGESADEAESFDGSLDAHQDEDQEPSVEAQSDVYEERGSDDENVPPSSRSEMQRQSLPAIMIHPPAVDDVNRAETQSMSHVNGQVHIDEAFMVQKRKREPSDPLKPQHRASLLPIEQSVPPFEKNDRPRDRPPRKHPRVQSMVEHASEPVAIDHLSSQRVLQDTLPQSFSAAGTELEPASPPPYYCPYSSLPSYPDGKHRPPMYWSSTLSEYIHNWLAPPSDFSSDIAESWQMHLEHLSLHTSITSQGPEEDRPEDERNLFYEADMYDELKLIRMRLPPSAQLPLAPPAQHEWLVLSCVNRRDGHDSDDESMDGAGEAKTDKVPYWVMAFPTPDVSSAKLEREAIDDTTGDGEQDEGEWKTTLTFARRGSVPLLHGYGIDEKFANAFVVACAEGRGRIEMYSTQRPLL